MRCFFVGGVPGEAVREDLRSVGVGGADGWRPSLTTTKARRRVGRSILQRQNWVPHMLASYARNLQALMVSRSCTWHMFQLPRAPVYCASILHLLVAEVEEIFNRMLSDTRHPKGLVIDAKLLGPISSC